MANGSTLLSGVQEAPSPPRPEQVPPGGGGLPPGFSRPVRPRTTQFSEFFSQGLHQQQTERDRPLVSGFLGDLRTMLTGTGRDIGQRLDRKAEAMRSMDARIQAGDSPSQVLLAMQDMAATEERARQRFVMEKHPSIIDLVGDVTASGFISGLQFGTRPLPIIGDFAEARLGPIQQDLEQEAQATLKRNVQAMNSKLGQTALAEIPAIVSGLAGTITGGYVAFKPWFALGNVLVSGGARIRQAGSLSEGLKDVAANIAQLQSGFMGDIAGSAIFGAATGERGFLSALTEGTPEDRFGQRLFEMQVRPEDPWWKQSLAQTVNRAEAAVAMGADDFAVATLFTTAFGGMGRMGAYATAKMKATRTQLLGGDPVDVDKIVAMRQAQILADPGTRRFAVLRTTEEANTYVDIRAGEELISKSADAQKVLAEQQSVEGIITYQTQIAALAAAVNEVHVSKEATHGVLRGIEDPFRMLQEIQAARTEVGEAAQRFRVPTAAEPLIHRADEIPEEGIFGYTEGLTRDPLTEITKSVDTRIPIFLKNRPKVPSVERGSVEEVVVVPGKKWEFESWNHVLEKYGSIDDMMRAARRNNVDLVNVFRTGAEGGQQHILLSTDAITSSKPVTPDVAPRVGDEPVDADRILRELGDEPLEVALKRRLPGMRFETPIRRDDGTYDLIFSQEGAPGMSGQQLKQFKETGFFSGQRVIYGGKTYEVLRRRGKKGQGKTIQLRDPSSGGEISVSVNNVLEYPSARIPMAVDDALYREWLDFFDERLTRIGDRQPDATTIRELAMASDDPVRMNRDFADDGLNAMIYPHEVMSELDIAESLAKRSQEINQTLQEIGTDFSRASEIQALVQEQIGLQQQIQQAARAAQAEGKLAEGINLDEAFVEFPDQLDYGTLLFNEWARQADIDMTPGEAQALKHTFYRRMNEEVFDRLPPALKEKYSTLQDELVEMWESLPDDVDTLAKRAGFELLRLKQGTLALRRPGSTYYEGMYANEEALSAALRRNLRYGGVPNMTPQHNWLDVSLPSGTELGGSVGAVHNDLHYLASEEAQKYVQRLKEWGSEFTPIPPFLKSKPAWILPFEDATGIPLWTEFIEPLFTDNLKSSNAQLPFTERWVRAFGGLDLDSRLNIKDFIRSVESHSDFVSAQRVTELGKEFGLNKKELGALKDMRGIMDELFQLGSNFFGWTPNDYIYTYLTKMRPVNEGFRKADLARSPASRYSDLVPEELDVFYSKYTRDGLLPMEEEDPLVIGMKYIRTMFHERHMKGSYERLSKFLNVKVRDLPPEWANNVIENMDPTTRRQLAENFDGIQNAPALPNSVRGPLEEMLTYMRGYPDETRDLGTRIVRTLTDKVLGVEVSERVAGEIINAGMLQMYGATLALRPKPVVRNTYQVISNLYPRLNASSVDIGLSRVMGPDAVEVFSRAVDDGIIDLTAKGLPFGQEIATKALEAEGINTRGIRGAIMGGLLRSTVLDGKFARMWRTFAEKGLSGIGHTDMFTRVWAAEAQDAFTRPWVTKFLNGKIDEKKLLKKGLPYWETSIRRKFVDLLETDGSESAMRYIRREASNTANYIYSKAAQPSALQKPLGRMGFQFGIWPMWRKDLYFRNIRNSRGLQERVAYATREAIATGGLALVGARFGMDMAAWMSHNAILSYSGGPAVGAVADLVGVFSAGDWEHQWAASKRLARDNVMRIVPPGRIFAEDVVKSLQYAQDDPTRGFMHMFFGRPTEDMMGWNSRMIHMMRMQEQERRAREEADALLEETMPLPNITPVQ